MRTHGHSHHNRYRTREAIRGQLPAYGGESCPPTRKEACNTDYCPVNCDYTWGGWGACDKSCGGGTKYRTPVVTIDGDYGGVPCPTDGQRAPCNTDYCAVDCAYEWGDWNTCDKSCEGGKATRNLIVSVQPGIM
jgi:hypothetical protein